MGYSYYAERVSNKDIGSMKETESRYTPIPSEDEGTDIVRDLYAIHVWRRRFYGLLFFSISVTSLFIASLLYPTNRISSGCPLSISNVKIPYSPAPVRYVNRNLTRDFDSSKFLGNPRLELDKAWHGLLNGTAIHISEEDVLRVHASNAVRLKDGGYIGGLGVMHSLHCIKRIKQYLHPEYYYSQGQQDWDDITIHIDHCLESLRTQALCKPDLSLYTFTWTPENKIKPEVQITQEAVCVDWDRVHEWMEERAATINDVIRPLGG
ncbi:uncharacterized protein GGS22DRAFT_186836 [Annulohypoxylon maeteangense]|uniref:uncharacterized protein n=1 Tax=Annulohypoxylon maeteangense TaxID=1927788 RepID=UPI002008700F|nr:uncharacterized protein GGS22DRAFT_186836 [Annulohypoxylon maeteangense]KAI0886763.1 hypothetical protein GGS22DRAFT_186836 [Annulohypoxylon maeteangense]